MNSAPANRHALRRTWIKQASDGERASLVGQWSLLQEELASDVAFADDLLIASMSKKGSPAFLWLCSVYPPSERVLRAGIARLSPDIISKALSGKPWPLGGTQVGLLGIEKALIQHPSGWQVALDNFNVCVNAGMPLPRDELYGVLYHLATSAPKKWMRLSSPNDNAIAGLIRAGVKVCEWPSRPRPEPGHALTAALECGNLVAATCLLSSTTSPFKVDYLDVLLGAVSGYPPKFRWPDSQLDQKKFLQVILERCGNKKQQFWEMARDTSRPRKIPQALLASIEAGALEEMTRASPSSSISRARRL